MVNNIDNIYPNEFNLNNITSAYTKETKYSIYNDAGEIDGTVISKNGTLIIQADGVSICLTEKAARTLLDILKLEYTTYNSIVYRDLTKDLTKDSTKPDPQFTYLNTCKTSGTKTSKD